MFCRKIIINTMPAIANKWVGPWPIGLPGLFWSRYYKRLPVSALFREKNSKNPLLFSILAYLCIPEFKTIGI
jgi:hypothetical protein